MSLALTPKKHSLDPIQKSPFLTIGISMRRTKVVSTIGQSQATNCAAQHAFGVMFFPVAFISSFVFTSSFKALLIFVKGNHPLPPQTPRQKSNCGPQFHADVLSGLGIFDPGFDINAFSFNRKER